ncbi:unnamed protein product [Fusarium graminearum]|uniref:Secreted protein CSS2 C-terminal domain-containing protein n=1 Tax=Gibberella zeae TaxID=5518 RepID=A0A2H3GWL2_GIBZA|nr:hypothetical protein FGRA07_08458 [Fusarium graminearum]CAG1968068.1 unnamed protein product [Fusarium graminearum]CAG2009314.1 unnamed protein product [Fusarium graminearum]
MKNSERSNVNSSSLSSGNHTLKQTEDENLTALQRLRDFVNNEDSPIYQFAQVDLPGHYCAEADKKGDAMEWAFLEDPPMSTKTATSFVDSGFHDESWYVLDQAAVTTPPSPSFIYADKHKLDTPVRPTRTDVTVDTRSLDTFIKASAAYIIPIASLLLNLAAYLNKDDIKPYEILGLIVFANIYILYYHLQGLELKDTALETRRKYKICERFPAIGASCDAIGETIMGIYGQLSGTAKYTTKMKMSGTFTGYAGPNNELFYRYRSLDITCDTTGEREAIAGAIEHHIKKHGSKVCGTECLHLTPQGGPWNGYLAIGPVESFDHEAYCGPKLSFKHCD